MILTFSQLENDILFQVIKQPCDTFHLYTAFVSSRKISKAGFYKALASLKKKEVVFVKDKMVSVNKIWLTKSSQFFRNLVKQKTIPGYLGGQISKLGNADRIVYTFNNISEIDIFILNLLYDLILLGTGKNILITEQHEFFVLLNNERTGNILSELKLLGIPVFLLIWGQSDSDKEVSKKYLKDPAFGYVPDGKRKLSEQNKITHVVGDIVVELRLDKNMAVDLDNLFMRQTHINEDFVSSLKKLVNMKRKHRIVICRDKVKATKLRVRFKQFFVGIE